MSVTSIHKGRESMTLRCTKCSCYITGRETTLPLVHTEQCRRNIGVSQVLELRESANVFDDFFSLAMGPSFDVRCYNGCIVGDLRFHTVELDSRRTTQKSGVMVIGESDASGTGDNNFYGVFDKVLHVQYPLGRNVWLFKSRCHQVDDHIEDDTLCRTDVDPTIVERPIVHHVTDDFIDDVDEHLSHASDDEL
ncbi:transposon protein, putative, CACTA, En/Spm sub-class [Cucumis melo var. makuwa]|uniref:Transposon protein, putative, CACTA, En/Spm sub-class n=1 Tax=Cucumis melo var. makuwa TaxID=1194695 RepID=A0A5A7V2M3_CUCMM|nr:transposon protein, putative, CACTA, En/Spm sub-class [Cucumis melo var. makuwa]TYK27420.1 transposon protein, putative, CACTA, En/Spm sub-class [Cucumis melo var. makuwa]